MVSVPPSKWQIWTEHIINLQQQELQRKADKERLLSGDYQKQLLAQIRADISRQSGVQFLSPNTEFIVKRYKLGEESANRDDFASSLAAYDQDGALERAVAQDLKWRIYIGELSSVIFNNSLLISVGDLGRCVNLRILHLAKNFITSIDGLIGNLPVLERLDLHSNQIVSLPPAFEWAGMKALKVLNLHDNLISEFDAARQLAGAPQLQILTMYDTIVSVRPNYRHFMVNVLTGLVALDHYVISDAEIIEDAQPTFMSSRFAPFTQPFFCDLCPAAPVTEIERQFELLSGLAIVHGLLCRVHRILKHFSPIIIIQRHFRGYVQRKRFAQKLRTLNPRQYPLLSDRRRAMNAEAVAKAHVSARAKNDASSAKTAAEPDRTLHIDVNRLDSRTIDKLDQDARVIDLNNESLMRYHLVSRHGRSSALNGPSAPHASVLSEAAEYQVPNTAATNPVAEHAELLSEAQFIESHLRTNSEGRLSSFCHNNDGRRPLAYELLSLTRMLDTSISSSMLISKQVLDKPLDSREPVSRIATENPTTIPFRVHKQPIVELDPLVESVVDKFKTSEDVRLAKAEIHRIIEDQHETYLEGQRELARAVDTEELRNLNKKKMEKLLSADRVPLRNLRTIDQLLFKEPKKQAKRFELSQRVFDQDRNSRLLHMQARQVLEGRAKLAHAQVCNEKQRLDELRTKHSEDKLNELRDNYSAVREWEQAKARARQERTETIKFASKQLTIGHTLEQNDHMMVKQVHLSQSRSAAQQQRITALITRKQIADYLQQERSFKRNSRKQQHLEADLLLLQRCNDQLYDARMRVDSLKNQQRQLRQYQRVSSHVTLLPLPTLSELEDF